MGTATSNPAMSAGPTPPVPAGGLGPVADVLATTSLALARRFAAGASLWCCAPAWPPHAQHVAVEFVHPVVMGTRALPAFVVPEQDPVAALRVLARPGDVVLVIAGADDPLPAELALRGQAWGVSMIWVGAGDRPSPGAADYVVWLEGEGATAHADGRFVLLYHLLWELTQVCFEHPGLLAVSTGDGPCADQVCITCSDEGRVVEVESAGDGAGAVVRAAGHREEVDASLVGAVVPGDLLLVHAGIAISRLGAAA